MPTPNDYFFVQGDKDDIAQKVKTHLDRGCELVGGICVTHIPGARPGKELLYTQALIDRSYEPTPFERGDFD